MRWTLLVFVAACAGGKEPEDPCLPGPSPTLEIGDGEYGFAPVEPGGELPLVHGPQGGFHNAIGLRATGIDASDIVAAHLEAEVDGVVLASTQPWLDFRCEVEHDGLVTWGTFLIYDAQPADLDGKTTTITASVTDAAGVEVSVTTDFVIRDRP